MFNLKKHYFDGIDEQGNVFIIYDTTLKIGGIPIPYASLIVHQNGQTVESRRLNHLNWSENRIHHTKLGFAGSWQPLEQLPPLTLFQRNKHKLIWHCHTAKADFRLNFNQKNYRGLGYAETLEMNFTPWSLPIDELRWGRFLSANHSLIWIEWRGELPLKKLLWNGKLIEEFDIDDDKLFIKEHNLSLFFYQPVIVKDEPLANITEQFKFLRFLIPAKFLHTRETKWKSEAGLTLNNQLETGFALYETVLWKK